MAFLAKTFAVLLWIPLLIWAAGDSAIRIFRPAAPYIFTPGVTFSDLQAEGLGIDKKEAYIAALDDLGARKLRLMAYWDKIEPEKDNFDFSDLDWEIRQAGARQAKVILAIGMKLPRWPECHIPSWAEGPGFENELLNYEKAVVEHYMSSSVIEAWQVENEPFFKFGICQDISKQQVTREVQLVRSLDERPIVITDSGELGTWFGAARLGDIIGTTMYRTTWKRGIGYMHYPLPASFYETKAKLINLLFKTPVIVSEMQTEPWGPVATLRDVSIDEQFKSMNFDKFKEAIFYARQSRISPVYFWGAEWWYWMKQNGHPEFWEYARDNIFRFSY